MPKLHASFGFVMFVSAAAGLAGTVTGVYVAERQPRWLSPAPLQAPAQTAVRMRPLPLPPGSAAAPAAAPAPAAELASIEPAMPPRALRMPIDGLTPAQLHDTFSEHRGGGRRRHDAIDILAPEGTPVRAVVDGRVVKLFNSAAGGLTVYQFDEAENFSYYYAHLQAYAPQLAEGRYLQQGEVLGFVGHTGNASAQTPHLHFAITRLNADKHWWQGEPLNPYPLLVAGEAPR